MLHIHLNAVGELKIKQLRERAKSSLGQNFDIIKFHDKILSFGAIPLQILDSFMHQQFETDGSIFSNNNFCARQKQFNKC